MENKIVDDIEIIPAHDCIDYDNGLTFDPEINKLKIKDYDKALELLGYHGMQRIYVSTTAMGLSVGLSSGDYISIPYSPAVFTAIKKELIELRAILQEQLDENKINN